MTSATQRKFAWEGLLNADFHARYYGRLASRYQRRSKWAAIIAASLSSGALVTLVDNTYNIPYLTEVLTLAVVFLTLYIGFSRIGRTAALASWQHARWTRIEAEYERLWERIDTLDADDVEGERWRLVKWSLEGAEAMPLEFGEDRKLAEQCQEETINARAGRATPGEKIPATTPQAGSGLATAEGLAKAT